MASKKVTPEQTPLNFTSLAHSDNIRSCVKNELGYTTVFLQFKSAQARAWPIIDLRVTLTKHASHVTFTSVRKPRAVHYVEWAQACARAAKFCEENGLEDITGV